MNTIYQKTVYNSEEQEDVDVYYLPESEMGLIVGCEQGTSERNQVSSSTISTATLWN